MDPVTGAALISGAASLVGGGINTVSSASDSHKSLRFTEWQNRLNRELSEKQLQQNMAFNAGEADRARKFSENMSNTAYQRATQDMRLAGINPMLAYTQGGASTPPGASASSSGGGASTSNTYDQKASNAGQGLLAAASTAMDYRRLKKEIEQTDSVISLNKASKLTKDAETLINLNSAKGVSLDNERKNAELPAQKAHGKIDATSATMDAIINRIKGAIPFWGGGKVGPK